MASETVFSLSKDNDMSTLHIKTNQTKQTTSNSYQNSSYLEMLPNEIFPIIFTNLHHNDIFHIFFDLNQRFRSLVTEFTTHLTIDNNESPKWIDRCMPYIENNIKTMKLRGHHIPYVFTLKYSYSNLRSITITSKGRYEWLMELIIVDNLPVIDVINALNVLHISRFEVHPSYYPYMYEKANSSIFYNWSQNFVDMIPCPAVRRLWCNDCVEDMLFWLGALAPKLTCLELPCLYPDIRTCDSIALVSHISTPRYLTEINIILDSQGSFFRWSDYNNFQTFIQCYQSSLKRVILDFNTDVITDGRWLESLFSPCPHLEYFSFINQCKSKDIDIDDLVQSFKSEWWLDICRPPVFIHKNISNKILIASMPCSFNFYFEFSTDFNTWYLNKEQIESSLIRFTKKPLLTITNTLPFTMKTLELFSHIFSVTNQILWCTNWELLEANDLFEQLTNGTLTQPILPNVKRMVINHSSGITALSFAVWLLLAPNIRTIIFETNRKIDNQSEQWKWLCELSDALLNANEYEKTIFKRIKKVESTCHDKNISHYEWSLKMETLIETIFPEANL
ncbi:hypothetical protein I4U23_014707 [Adineta vaga]|nr:hypothetical protein I4U23_014707 [Adineta vaga]